MTKIGPFRLELWLPNLFALREMKRGADTVVKKLGQMKKAMEDQGMPTHDIRELLHVWEGHDGEDGILQQLSEQLSLHAPRPAPSAAQDGPRQLDAFAGGEIPRYTDGPLTDVEPLSPDSLRDILADQGVHIPAAIIAAWPLVDRHAAEAYLRESGFDAALVAPAWLVSWPLPEGFQRDAEGHVWDDRDHVPARLSVEELEQLAAEEVQQQEALAEKEAHEEQPWVVVDLVSGAGLRRYQVMHRTTRRRVNVSEDFVADTNTERETNEQEALGDREAADAYAMYLSKVTPDDQPEAEAAADDEITGDGTGETLPEIKDGADGEDLLGGETEERADEDEFSDPAPALVVSLLKKCGRVIPLALAERWTAAERAEVANFAAAAGEDGWDLTPAPACIAGITWTKGPKGSLIAAEVPENEAVPA